MEPSDKELKKETKDYHIKLRLRRMEEHIKILLASRAMNAERINELEDKLKKLNKKFVKHAVSETKKEGGKK